MPKLADAQFIELFHVAFLDALSRKLNPRRYVLKGGANLRYFFHSPRYSEGIDLDVSGVPEWRLEEKVDEILRSPQLKILLRYSGLEVEETSKPKQTATTQRWKAGLRPPGGRHLMRTKIEFSSRGDEGRYRLEAIPSAVVQPYGLRPPSVQHYVEDTPTKQKVLALAGRRQTQARDVFDLDLLLRARPLPSGSLEEAVLVDAADRALELSFAEFRDQVIQFLEPDAVALYDSPDIWEAIQTQVAGQLEAAV